MIIEQMKVGDFEVFAYIVGCEETGEGVVIDPAADVDRILGMARSKGIREIKYLINTHCHADHVGGNKELKALTGAQILIHQEDADRLSSPPDFILQIFHCEASPPPDRMLSDGERIEIGRQSLSVIHTPGHTPGGICLYAPGHLFTGDTLFVGAVGRTDLPGGSVRQLLNSIRTRLFTLPADTVVYPGHDYGHSPRSTVGEEKRYNPFLK